MPKVSDANRAEKCKMDEMGHQVCCHETVVKTRGMVCSERFCATIIIPGLLVIVLIEVYNGVHLERSLSGLNEAFSAACNYIGPNCLHEVSYRLRKVVSDVDGLHERWSQ